MAAITGHSEPDRAILKAFYVQYVAVLLILLSFMIGSIAGEQGKKPGSMTVVPPAAPGLLKSAFVTFQLNQVFEGSSDRIIVSDTLNAIIQVGLSHDVDLEFSVPVEGELGSELRSQLASSRATALMRFAVEQGIPARAVRSWADLDATENRLGVRLTGLTPENR